MRNVLALLVVLMLATPVFAASRPFPEKHNFMSCVGYERYLIHKATGKWVKRDVARSAAANLLHCQ